MCFLNIVIITYINIYLYLYIYIEQFINIFVSRLEQKNRYDILNYTWVMMRQNLKPTIVSADLNSHQAQL